MSRSDDTWVDGEPPAPPAAETPPAPERYALGDLLGEGGMGEVRAARDQRLKRELAVKRLTHPAPGARARFEAEAQVTAQLEHPNIVPVHDLWVGPDGRPCMAMKRIKGDSLRPWLAGAPTLERRLEVFRRVCDAMAFAHSRGVIHRDLKPDNVMVGEFGEVMVMDWGLARPIGSSSAEVEVDRFSSDAGRTREGQLAGTPETMAPEQAEGRLADLGAATDVYALGVLLYEMVTGHRPFSGETADVLAAVRAGRFRPPRTVAPSCPEELERVILRAMQLRPEARYPSAAALREDIEAFVERRPLPHLGSTNQDRLKKWAHRHSSALNTGAVVMVSAMVLLLAAGARFSMDLGRARDAAVAEADKARSAEREARLREAAAAIALADTLSAAGRRPAAREKLLEARDILASNRGDLRVVELALSETEAQSPSAVSRCPAHEGLVLSLSTDAEGARAASWGADGALRITDTASCERIFELLIPGDGKAGRGQLSLEPGGLRAAVSRGETLILVEAGRVVATHTLPGAPRVVGLSATGAWASLGDGRSVRVEGDQVIDEGAPFSDPGWWTRWGDLRLRISLPTGGEPAGVWGPRGSIWEGAGVMDIAVDEGRAFATNWAGILAVDLGSGELLWESPTVPLRNVGANGERAWAFTHNHQILVFDTATGAVVDELGGAGALTVGAAARDVRVMVAGGADGAVSTWVRGRPTRLGQERPPTQALALSPDGTVLAAADDGGRLRLFDPETGAEISAADVDPQGARDLAFDPTGRRIAVAGRSGAVLVLDLGGAVLHRVPVGLRAVSVSWLDENRILTGDAEGMLHRVDLRDGGRTSVSTGTAWDFLMAADGSILAGNHGGGRPGFRRFSPNGDVLAEGPSTSSFYQPSTDGTRVAAGDETGMIHVLDARTMKETARWSADAGPTMSVAFSPDGHLLASTGFGGRLCLWDPDDGTLLRAIELGAIGAEVLFHPDGRTLFVSAGDGLIRRVPLKAWEELGAARAALPAEWALAALGWWGRLEAAADPVWRARAAWAAGRREAARAAAAEAKPTTLTEAILAGG